MAEEDDDMPTAPFWMATFSDMATLLLTFFVLLVAMSEVEVKKFKEALSFFQGRTGMMQHEAVVPSMTTNVTIKMGEQTDSQELRARAETYEKLLEQLAENNLEGMVQVNMTEDGLHVIITDSVMFQSGAATLIEPSRLILSTIADVMAESEVESVIVEGHTDDRPIRTSRFPSNWELSAARAGSVVRFLLEQEATLAPERYQAVGHGEFKPRATNRTPDGRSRNRRVEILYSWQPWQSKNNPIATTTE
jgi:chemotaxis protein MotB